MGASRRRGADPLAARPPGSWAAATARRFPRPPTTCCAICGATAASRKRASAPPPGGWRSWACPRPLGRDALRDALTPEESDWLDHILRIDPATLPRAVRASLPDWLDERLGAYEDADALVDALNRPAPLDLRVNPLKADRDAVLRGLHDGPAARYQPRAMPFSPWGIRLAGHPPVNRWPQFEAGEIEVQDEGSQLAGAAGGAAARRDDHRLLRRRGRQDLAAGRLDALHRAGYMPSTSRRRAWRGPSRASPAAGCPTWCRWSSTARTTPGSSAWPARRSGCWWTLLAAASARCGAIRT